MTRHMEVPRDFINQDVAIEMAALLVVECLHQPVVIDVLAVVVGVPVPASVLLLALDVLQLTEGLSAAVESLLGEGASEVHEVGAHNVLGVETDDIARKGQELDIDVDL